MPSFMIFPSGALRLDRDGCFWHGQQRVEHPRILSMLRAQFQRLEGGGYGYQLGPHRVEVELEDAPFVVESVIVGDQEIRLWLSNDQQQALRPETLEYRGDVPYCRLENDDPARFLPGAALTLGHQLEQRGDDFVLCLGGQETVIPLGD